MTPRRRRRPSYVRDPHRDDIDPDHHLWRNGRRWWIALTVHLPDGTARRIRRSLGTPDVERARRRRDRILDEIERMPAVALSLRYARVA